MDKLQGSSNRDGWRTELPKSGLGDNVLVQMRDEKQKDVTWQGKCSGTVYVSIIIALYNMLLASSLELYVFLG